MSERNTINIDWTGTDFTTTSKTSFSIETADSTNFYKVPVQVAISKVIESNITKLCIRFTFGKLTITGGTNSILETNGIDRGIAIPEQHQDIINAQSGNQIFINSDRLSSALDLQVNTYWQGRNTSSGYVATLPIFFHISAYYTQTTITNFTCVSKPKKIECSWNINEGDNNPLTELKIRYLSFDKMGNPTGSINTYYNLPTSSKNYFFTDGNKNNFYEFQLFYKSTYGMDKVASQFYPPRIVDEDGYEETNYSNLVPWKALSAFIKTENGWKEAENLFIKVDDSTWKEAEDLFVKITENEWKQQG